MSHCIRIKISREWGIKPEIIDTLLQEAKELQKKLDAVNSMLSAYGYSTTQSSQSSVPQVNNKRSSPTDKTQKVRERCLPLITAQNGIPIKTRDVLEVLKKEGYEIGGKNEVATLSAMLSNSGEFEAIGRSGWVLKDKNKQGQVNEKGPSAQTQGPSQNLMGVHGLSERASYPNAVGSNPTTSTNVDQTNYQKGGVYGTFNPSD